MVDQRSFPVYSPSEYPGDYVSALQVHKEKQEERTDWENPARAWLCLVRAFTEKNPLKISRMIRLAKTSPWTMQNYDSSQRYETREEPGPPPGSGEYLDEFLPDPHAVRLERESGSDPDAISSQDSDDAILW